MLQADLVEDLEKQSTDMATTKGEGAEAKGEGAQAKGCAEAKDEATAEGEGAEANGWACSVTQQGGVHVQENDAGNEER